MTADTGFATNLETKTTSAEVGTAFDGLMTSYESFRVTNDDADTQMEQRGHVDPVTAEQLARLNKAVSDNNRLVSELTMKSLRPQLSSKDAGRPRSAASLQHKSAFNAYVRQGESVNLRHLEAKAMSIGSDPDGGYLVPDETETAINSAVRDISPIRAIAGVRQVSASVYKQPFSITGAATGWVGETAARPQTNAPTLAELAFPTMELYAMPAATSSLLDDSAVNIDEWLAEEIRVAFAEQEGAAFVNGDGVNKPRGFLDYPTVADASWSWGNIGLINTGAAGAFPASNPGDKLIDLVYAVKSGYRSNGTFVMNRATESAVRKMKDSDGNYLWQPASKPGEASTLMGFPVAESEDMPDIATGADAIAFGDFRRGYLIVDRVGIRVLRDPYSAKPYVLFYTTKRVGGGVQDFGAIKLLRFAA